MTININTDGSVTSNTSNTPKGYENRELSDDEIKHNFATTAPQDSGEHDEWAQADLLMRFPPELLKIFGKHSKHWNYDKMETLILLDNWLVDNASDSPSESTAERKSDLSGASPEAPQIHSDETREAIKEIIGGAFSIYRASFTDKPINKDIHELYVKIYTEAMSELLAKEQTRLLDRVLEALPNKHTGLEMVHSYASFHDDGWNQAVTEVTSTIQKLKEEIV